MQLACKNCKAKILAEDVNLERMVAKCRACHAVFGFRVSQESSQEPKTKARPELPTPAGFTLQKTPTQLSVSWPHEERTVGVVLVSIAFFVDLLVVSRFLEALIDGLIPSTVVLFGVVGFLFFNLLFLGLPLSFAFNNYRLRVSLPEPTSEDPFRGQKIGTRLELQCGPVPPRVDKKIPGDAIDQVFCQEHKGFRLCLLLKDGTNQILGSFPNQEQALFLEQQIESFLQIQDRVVTSEVVR